MTADDVVTAARACLGTPFAHQGRINGVALDCAGLAVSVAQKLGVEYADFQGYGREPYNGQLESALDTQLGIERVPDISDMQAGDLLLMRFSANPQHVAIFTGQNIIHSYESVGICCEHRLSDIWLKRIVRVYRFKGLS